MSDTGIVRTAFDEAEQRMGVELMDWEGWYWPNHFGDPVAEQYQGGLFCVAEEVPNPAPLPRARRKPASARRRVRRGAGRSTRPRR